MTEQRLAGKVALVTGSSRGIGRAIVLRLAREGADVAINYSRDGAAARDVLAEVEATGRRGILIKANLANVSETRAMIETEQRTRGQSEWLGGVDVHHVPPRRGRCVGNLVGFVTQRGRTRRCTGPGHLVRFFSACWLVSAADWCRGRAGELGRSAARADPRGPAAGVADTAVGKAVSRRRQT